MARNMKDINYSYIGDAIPAFLTISAFRLLSCLTFYSHSRALVMVPLTFNIA
jgi:xanthine/uracil/vitamin C permease (AzgA family)